MAGNRNPYGPNVMTVQEATNQVAQRRVIRVFPTLAEAAVSDTVGDVLVASAEIPNAVLRPGGCSSLINVWLMDYEDVQSDEDHYVIFHQHNAAVFGALDATADISVDDLKADKILGVKLYDSNVNETLAFIDNVKLNELQGINANVAKVPLPIFLQAEENSTSVYFTVIQKAVSGNTPDWDTGDLEFIFHIEY